MDIYVLPNCSQCDGNLADGGGELFCMSCGLPHPEVSIPEGFEDLGHSSLESNLNQVHPPTLAEMRAAISASDTPVETETHSHKPGKKKKQ